MYICVYPYNNLKYFAVPLAVEMFPVIICDDLPIPDFGPVLTGLFGSFLKALHNSDSRRPIGGPIETLHDKNKEDLWLNIRLFLLMAAV